MALIVNMERSSLGNGQGLRRSCFRSLIWRDVVLSLLNKDYINSSAIGRHGGGVIND